MNMLTGFGQVAIVPPEWEGLAPDLEDPEGRKPE